MLSEVARDLEAEMPRRRRKKYKSHQIRAGIQRDVERLARGQAANFDDQGHGSGLGSGRRQKPKKAVAISTRSTTARPACLAHWAHKSRPAAGRQGAAGPTRKPEWRCRAERARAPAAAAPAPSSAAPR